MVIKSEGVTYGEVQRGTKNSCEEEPGDLKIANLRARYKPPSG